MIDPRGKPERAIVGRLAHELRHALELADSGVTMREQFTAFYETRGRRWSGAYETDEASRAGFRARVGVWGFHQHP